jgi:hypothetical protein
MKSGMNAGLGNIPDALAEAGMAGGLDVRKRKRKLDLEAGADAGLEGALEGQSLSRAGLKGGLGGMKKGGKVSSASKRADGCAVRGKTRA